MQLRNLAKAAMTSAMMSCIDAVLRAAAPSPSSIMNRAKYNMMHASYPMQKCGSSARNGSSLSFCWNAKKTHASRRSYPSSILRHSRRHITYHLTCNKSKLRILPWRVQTGDRYLNEPTQILHSQSSSLSSKNDGESQTTTMELSDLSEIMNDSYNSGETDGVQAALSSNNILATMADTLEAEEAAEQLVGAAIEAVGSGRNRGKLAAILNAILASCCDCDSIASSTSHPEIALAILDLMDDMHARDDTTMVVPDIVSLSLVYYSLHQHSQQQQQQHDPQKFESESQAILERAQRVAKKTAGSQRRKALAAERRRGSNADEVDAKEIERRLQSLYGPDIRMLHETDDMVIMAKPAGMVCYHTKKTTAGKLTSSRKKKSRAGNNKDNNSATKQIMDISLVDALLDIPLSLSTLNPIARGVVHRLDRGTSGTIVLAKTDEAHLRLVASFFLRRIEKKYLALVPGCRDVGDERLDDLDNDDEKSPLPLTVGATGMMDAPVDGRPARSTYKVVGEYGKQQQQQQSSSSSSSIPEALLLEVETLTGRKHQVRVHCASLGHPILLDPLYSSFESEEKSKTKEKGQKKKKKKSTAAARIKESSPSALPNGIGALLDNPNKPLQEYFFLHATSLSIPELGVSVNAPLPNWWVDAVDELQV